MFMEKIPVWEDMKPLDVEHGPPREHAHRSRTEQEKMADVGVLFAVPI